MQAGPKGCCRPLEAWQKVGPLGSPQGAKGQQRCGHQVAMVDTVAEAHSTAKQRCIHPADGSQAGRQPAAALAGGCAAALPSTCVMRSRGGTPSITQPPPPPCDSPIVVTRKLWPKVLPAAATRSWRLPARAVCRCWPSNRGAEPKLQTAAAMASHKARSLWMQWP